MTIRPLRRLRQDDLSNNVVHFTGRRGRGNDLVPAEILRMLGRERLIAILTTRRIRAFDVFGSCGDPVVCFSEATLAGMRELAGTGRYDAWGIEFAKDYVFRQGGGPAFYVRGDHWDAFCQSDLPRAVKALGTKYWPGVDWTGPGWREVSATLSTASEWAHEREWRIPVARPGEEAPPAEVTFEYVDVAGIVAPTVTEGNELKGALTAEVRHGLERTPIVALAAATAAEDRPVFVVRLRELDFERARTLFARFREIADRHPGPLPVAFEIERSGGGVSRLATQLRVDGSAELRARLEAAFAPDIVVQGG